MNGEPIKTKLGIFPQMKAGSVLSTAEGRAEVLLTPGVFLRLDEQSEARLVTNSLLDTQVQLLRGTAMVEVAEVRKDNGLALVYGSNKFQFRKAGLYRFDLEEPASFRAYEGEADVTAAGQEIRVKAGRVIALDDSLTVAKFDKQVGDPFYRWNSRRAGSLATVNMAAARSMSRSGYGLMASGWQYVPAFGFMTYVPYRGVYWSPFGYGFWSPGQVMNSWMYYPRYPVSPGYAGSGPGAGSQGTNTAALEARHSGFAQSRPGGAESRDGFMASPHRNMGGQGSMPSSMNSGGMGNAAPSGGGHTGGGGGANVGGGSAHQAGGNRGR